MNKLLRKVMYLSSYIHMYIYLTSTYRGGRVELAQKRKWFLSQSAFYKIVLSNFLHYCVNCSSLRSTSVLQIKKKLC